MRTLAHPPQNGIAPSAAHDSGSPPAMHSPGIGIDFERLFHLILSRWWVIALCLLLGIGATLAYLATAQKIYAARTVIQVEQRDRRVLKIDEVAPIDLMSLETLKTYEQALASRTLLLKVAKLNGLDKVKGFGLDDLGQPVGEERLASRMSDAVSVKLRRGTRLIDITVEDVDPARARTVADSLVAEFLRQGFAEKVAVTKEANAFLLTEAEKFKIKLQKSEQDLQAYREKYQSVSLEDRQNITVERLKEISTQVTLARGMRLKLEADIASLGALKTGSSEDLLKIPSIAALPEIAEIRRMLLEKEAELGVLQKRYLERHPKHIAAVSLIRELQNSLQSALSTAGEKLQRSYAAARETELRFEEALKEQEKEALELNKLSIPYNVLEREVESDRAMFQSVLARAKETSVSQNIDSTPIRIVEEAILPQLPIKPQRMKLLAMALIGSCGLGLGIILGLDQLNQSFRGVDDLETVLGAAVLAVIQKLDTPSEGPLLPAEGTGARSAEGFRALRASISLGAHTRDARSFLFTSSSPGEGKSFCSANFAGVLAQLGHKTVLIDADLRRPVVASRFALRGAGLTDLLKGNVTIEEALQETADQNLCVLTAGSYSETPSELLGNGRFPVLLSQLLERFDRVVVDSAPVNAVSDTLIIASTLDATCLVVHAEKTHRRGVIRAKRLLDRAQARIAGVVFNQVNERGSSYYYGYSGYGENYSATPPIEEARLKA